MRIVVDTSIIWKEGFTYSHLFKFLVAATQIAGDTIQIPAVVVFESKARFEEELRTKQKGINKEFKKLQNILGRCPQPNPINLNVAEETRILQKRLEGFGPVLDLTEASHESLVKRAVYRKRPFDENGSGYRDTLIWTSVVELATNTDENVILLSEDKIFKAAKGEHLSKQLKDELSSLGLPDGKVILVRSVSSFLERFVRPRLEEALQGDPTESLMGLGIDPREDICLAIQDEHLGREWRGEELGLLSEYETLHLSLVEDISDLERIDGRELRTGRYWLKIRATLECEFDAFVHKSEVFGLDDFSVHEFDWNNHYAMGGISRSLRCEMDVTVDFPSGADAEIAVLSMQPVATYL